MISESLFWCVVCGTGRVHPGYVGEITFRNVSFFSSGNLWIIPAWTGLSNLRQLTQVELNKATLWGANLNLIDTWDNFISMTLCPSLPSEIMFFHPIQSVRKFSWGGVRSRSRKGFAGFCAWHCHSCWGCHSKTGWNLVLLNFCLDMCWIRLRYSEIASVKETRQAQQQQVPFVICFEHWCVGREKAKYFWAEKSCMWVSRALCETSESWALVEMGKCSSLLLLFCEEIDPINVL